MIRQVAAAFFLMSCKVHTLLDQVCVFWSIVVYGKMGQINFGAVFEIKC